MLKHESFIANVGDDTAENEPSKVCLNEGALNEHRRGFPAAGHDPARAHRDPGDGERGAPRHGALYTLSRGVRGPGQASLAERWTVRSRLYRQLR